MAASLTQTLDQEITTSLKTLTATGSKPTLLKEATISALLQDRMKRSTSATSSSVQSTATNSMRKKTPSATGRSAFPAVPSMRKERMWTSEWIATSTTLMKTA